jgi:hypothetical protein
LRHRSGGSDVDIKSGEEPIIIMLTLLFERSSSFPNVAGMHQAESWLKAWKRSDCRDGAGCAVRIEVSIDSAKHVVYDMKPVDVVRMSGSEYMGNFNVRDHDDFVSQ